MHRQVFYGILPGDIIANVINEIATQFVRQSMRTLERVFYLFDIRSKMYAAKSQNIDSVECNEPFRGSSTHICDLRM